jgi:hypothetical protein
MAYIPGKTLQYHMNRLAGTLNAFDVPTLDAQGAANVYAGTTGLAIVGALNSKAGTSGLELQGVLNYLAGTSGLGENEASARIQPWYTSIPTKTSLSVWYDASAVNGIAQPNPDNNANVLVWNDLSGNGKTLNQLSGTSPTFASAPINNQPAVLFGGQFTGLYTSTAYPLTAAKSIYAVMQRTSNGANNQNIFAQRNPSTLHQGFQIRFNSATNPAALDYRVATSPDNTTITGTATAATGTTYVHSMIVAGSGVTPTAYSGYQNGSLKATATANGGTFTESTNTFNVGGVPSLYDNAIGYYATILVYDIAHTNAERLSIERWLGSRYNISVA